jgi:hypothetical protein
MNEYDLSYFSGNWVIGDVPAANVKVIVGEQVRTSTLRTFTNSKDTTYEIKLNGELIFSGYIYSSSYSQSSTVSGSGIELNVQLVGSAAVLKGEMASRYRFYNGSPKRIESATESPEAQVQLGELLPCLDGARINPDNELEDTDFPGTIIQGFSDLNRNEIPELSNPVDPADYLVGEAHIREEILTSSLAASALRMELMRLMAKRWATGNLWDSIKQVSNYFYLHLVPRNQLMEISPLLPWQKTPDFTLTDSDIIGVTNPTQLSALLKAPDAVYVVLEPPDIPNKKRTVTRYLEYPSDLTGKGKAALVTLPPWLAKRAETLYYTKVNKDTKKGRVKDRDVDSTDDRNMDTVAYAVARIEFANRRNGSSILQVKVPWNYLEYINKLGLVGKVAFSAPGIGSQQLYGMLQSASLTVGVTPGSGVATMSLGFSSVRDADSNESYGIDEHPIYETTSGDNSRASAAAESDSTFNSTVLGSTGKSFNSTVLGTTGSFSSTSLGTATGSFNSTALGTSTNSRGSKDYINNKYRSNWS